MTESMLQQQLNEVRKLVTRARELFGPKPIQPPASEVRPDPMVQ